MRQTKPKQVLIKLEQALWMKMMQNKPFCLQKKPRKIAFRNQMRQTNDIYCEIPKWNIANKAKHYEQNEVLRTRMRQKNNLFMKTKQGTVKHNDAKNKYQTKALKTKTRPKQTNLWNTKTRQYKAKWGITKQNKAN